MKLFTKHKQIHRHRKEIYGYQRGKGERDKLRAWDLEISKTDKILVLFSKLMMQGIENKHTQRQCNFE